MHCVTCHQLRPTDMVPFTCLGCFPVYGIMFAHLLGSVKERSAFKMAVFEMKGSSSSFDFNFEHYGCI